MNFLSIGIYFLFLGMGLGAIYIAYGLARRYRFRFLDYYFYSIVFGVGYGFVNYLGKMFAGQVLAQSKSWDALLTAHIIISSLASPLMIVSTYMMICWILDLLWGKVPRWFKIGFWLWQVLFILVFFTSTKIYFETKNFESVNPLIAALEKIQMLIVIIAVLCLVLKGKSLENKARGKLAFNLGILLFTCTMVFFGSYLFILPNIIASPLAYFSAFAFLHLLTELVPLFYLKAFLEKHHAELAFSPVEVHGIKRFFDEFKMTEREQSIIRLILKGKTNDEIGDELFISTKTVKNNISNIYQKAKVKNRIQLTNLVRGFREKT